MARKLDKSSVKKPSFFKILIGDFSTNLGIPPAFFSNFNGRPLRKFALKGPSGKLWAVELEERVNGLVFGRGWQGFVKDHLLQVGDFVVFHYDSKSKFKVEIYDRSACEKDVEVPERSGNPGRVKEETVDLETENCNEDCENNTVVAGSSGNVMTGKKRPRAGYVKETSARRISFKSKNPCFMETLKKHQQYRLYIPKGLAIAAGLMSRSDVMLRNETAKAWPVKIVTYPNGRVEFTSGWGECRKANRISVGDTVVFESVRQSVIKMHIFRAVGGKRCSVELNAPM